MTEQLDSYRAFLDSKRIVAEPCGLDWTGELCKHLKDWQEAVVRWALGRGRAALFEGCGLGKTVQSLEWGRVVSQHTGAPVLLLAPLAVSMQTIHEAQKFGIPGVRRISSDSDVGTGINVINYDRLHYIDESAFSGVILDESSILKAFNGKTRNAIISAFSETPFRLACTATPAPNDYMELGNHAEFLGIMTRAEMLATFFNHDGGNTSQWRLKPHGEHHFWKWMASWSMYIQKPGDIGFSNEGYDLPPLRKHELVIQTDATPGYLFPVEVSGLHERRQARRASMEQRIEECLRIVESEPADRWIVWCELNDEQSSIEAALGDRCISVYGSLDPDEKERRLYAWLDGQAPVLVSKPSICGHGLNLQSCSRMIYVGLSDSWEMLYQSIRRSWRFGQVSPVNVYFVMTDQEGPILRNISRKEEAAEVMAEAMAEHMSVFERESLRQSARRDEMEYETDDATGDGWRLMLGDCVERCAEIADDSVGLSVFSPPFASLYTYSASDRDMGNASGDSQFMEHLRFLVRELYRVTMPGRHVSFHCMNLPTSKWKDGVIGLRDFRGALIRAFEEFGWIYHSEVCIWKDPVTAMQRTKALGLLWKQIKKDSTMSRMGLPDYMVTMRKPGDNPSLVSHTAEEFPVSQWQKWASPVWMDIDPSDTLQFRTAREERDERHICPLQLGVIERTIELWSNPGDLILSPFAGIGSEGYQAVKQGRRFIGIELKRSYFEEARKNMALAETEMSQASLFCAEGAQ